MDLEKVTTFLLHRIECWNVLGPSVSPYIISPAMGGGIYIYMFWSCSNIKPTCLSLPCTYFLFLP